MNLLELILTILMPILAIALLWWKIKRWIPQLLQTVLDDVGESLAGSLSDIFEKPAVSRAMGILGKASGESRAAKGAENALAQGILDQIPEAKIILDRVAPNIIEDYGADTVLQLASKYATMLRGLLSGMPNVGAPGAGETLNRPANLRMSRYW